jgi:hypothetical protein
VKEAAFALAEQGPFDKVPDRVAALVKDLS